MYFRYINSDTAVPGEVGPQQDLEEAVPMESLDLGDRMDSSDPTTRRAAGGSLTSSLSTIGSNRQKPSQPQLSVLPLRYICFLKPSQKITFLMFVIRTNHLGAEEHFGISMKSCRQYLEDWQYLVLWFVRAIWSLRPVEAFDWSAPQVFLIFTGGAVRWRYGLGLHMLFVYLTIQYN